MSFAGKLTQAYFNIAYNQVYDFITARLSPYRILQGRCVSKLELRDNDKVLCVGLGTGNEIVHILKVNRNIDIVGVDYSTTALKKARIKASRLGKEIELLLMNARSLEFNSGNFDKVVCIHVMDFIDDHRIVTSEILRVLKDGGQFVVTYPSDKEGPRLGRNLLRESIRNDLDSGKRLARVLWETLAQVVVGTVYLPLLLRPKRRAYSHRELEAMVTELAAEDFRIEEDAVYQDFIVYGRK